MSFPLFWMHVYARVLLTLSMHIQQPFPTVFVSSRSTWPTPHAKLVTVSGQPGYPADKPHPTSHLHGFHAPFPARTTGLPLLLPYIVERATSPHVTQHKRYGGFSLLLFPRTITSCIEFSPFSSWSSLDCMDSSSVKGFCTPRAPSDHRLQLASLLLQWRQPWWLCYLPQSCCMPVSPLRMSCLPSPLEPSVI